MFPKVKRMVDRELLDSFHDRPCRIGNKDCFGQVVAHHVKTKKSGGGDVEANLWALCVFHHRSIHDLGTYTFCLKNGIKHD